MANLKNLTPGDGEMLHSERFGGWLDTLMSIRLTIFAYVDETQQ